MHYLHRQRLGTVAPNRMIRDHLKPLSLADLYCHTLLIDDDTRHRSYCLLPLSRVDVDEAVVSTM